MYLGHSQKPSANQSIPLLEVLGSSTACLEIVIIVEVAFYYVDEISTININNNCYCCCC